MNTPSEMYPVFESPFPTLLTHTDNGLGIFVAHPKVDIVVKNIGADENIFRVAAGTLDFFFPLKEHAQALLLSRGGVIAFTDEAGMPWYTLVMTPKTPQHVVKSTNVELAPKTLVSPRLKFGRPSAKAEPQKLGDEGEFSL